MSLIQTQSVSIIFGRECVQLSDKVIDMKKMVTAASVRIRQILIRHFCCSVAKLRRKEFEMG